MSRTDTVKAVLWGAAGLGAVFLIWRTYTTAQRLGGTVGNTAQAIEQQLVAGIGAMSQAMGAAADQVRAGIDKAGSLFDFSSREYSYPTPKALGSTQWDDSTRTMIADLNRAKGRKPGDYSGWQVFTDGTVITPAGDYLKMDYASPALESPTGWAAASIWSPAGQDLLTAKYPGAETFIAQGWKNEPTTAPMAPSVPPYHIAF